MVECVCKPSGVASFVAGSTFLTRVCVECGKTGHQLLSPEATRALNRLSEACYSPVTFVTVGVGTIQLVDGTPTEGHDSRVICGEAEP